MVLKIRNIMDFIINLVSKLKIKKLIYTITPPVRLI